MIKKEERTRTYIVMGLIFNVCLLLIPIALTGIVLGIPYAYDVLVISAIWGLWSLILGVIEVQSIESKRKD
jgi:hypothetical protein